MVDKLREFSANANQLTLAGIIFVFVTTMLLLMNVERTFNAIWDVADVRRGTSTLLHLLGRHHPRRAAHRRPRSSQRATTSACPSSATSTPVCTASGYRRSRPPATFTLLYYAVPSTPVRIASRP